MKDLIVGIDLGTTNSEIAVVRDGQIRVLPVHGRPILPSCVGLDAAGRILVGQAARNQLVAAPEATILSIKRKMGQDVKVPLGGRELSPEEISSFILRELKTQAELELGEPVTRAVITVPAYFNERQRKATQIAGELAGLEVVRILNEPTAAALAYGAGETADERLLVYDLGGGTFDVSVVVVEQGVVEVKASHGDTQLGGDDFDQLLVDHAVLAFKQQHNVDLIPDPRALRRLKVVLEAAKCRLSDEPFVRVREEYLDGQHHLELEITRADYEAMIRPLVEKTLDCVHKALEDARLTPGQLDKVMLVGGATRTPLVQALLTERLRIEPRWEIDPDLIVAMGAAVQGGVLGGAPRSAILVDITPHTFSMAALAPRGAFDELVCAPLIRRNTPLPAAKAELFSTVYDNQSQVQISAYQGEGELPEDNVLIGEFLIEGLSKAPAGNEVVVHFAMDLNGLLKVTATEKATGLSKSVTLDTRSQRVMDLAAARKNLASFAPAPDPAGDSEDADADTDADTDGAEDLEDVDVAGEAEGAAAGAPGAPGAPGAGAEPESGAGGDAPTELLTTAKDLRKRADVLLGRELGAEDAGEIRSLIQASATAIKARDWGQLAATNDTLSDLLFYLED
jgi:molecular chaperone DnaK